MSPYNKRQDLQPAEICAWNYFPKLPYELRAEIFAIVVRDIQPHVVEIFWRCGVIYSKTAPPALAHVCRESRTALLRIYKPWLPQFEGSTVHTRWMSTLGSARANDASNLDHVFLNLEHDTLLLRSHNQLERISFLRDLGLRRLQIDLSKLFHFDDLCAELRNFKVLEEVAVFMEDDHWAGYKVGVLNRYLKESEKHQQDQTNYKAPRIVLIPIPPPSPHWQSSTTYKYRVGGKRTLEAPETRSKVTSNPGMPQTKKRTSDVEELVDRNYRKPIRSAQVPPIEGHPQSKQHEQEVERIPMANTGVPRSPATPKHRTTHLDASQAIEPTHASSPSSIATEDEIFNQLAGNLNHASSGKPIIPLVINDEMPRLDLADDEAADKDSDLYAVEKFVAERQTPEGLEILVQWEGYPDEEDRTWERADALVESVPEMLEEWYDREDHGSLKDDENEQGVYEVEKIIIRQKIDGKPHYLVKWVGFDEIKDRTWEPCARLRIDVPYIVEEYERRKGKKA